MARDRELTLSMLLLQAFQGAGHLDASVAMGVDDATRLAEGSDDDGDNDDDNKTEQGGRCIRVAPRSCCG